MNGAMVGATAGAMDGMMEWKTDQATVGAIYKSMDGERSMEQSMV